MSVLISPPIIIIVAHVGMFVNLDRFAVVVPVLVAMQARRPAIITVSISRKIPTTAEVVEMHVNPDKSASTGNVHGLR
jgi:hypothetical protein